VITSVSIRNFRGVHQGSVAGLAPISILVGPNNMGKSTVLETIALASKVGVPSEAAKLLLRRGGPRLDALEHVLHVGESAAEIRIQNKVIEDKTDKWMLTLSRSKVSTEQLDIEGKPMKGSKTQLTARITQDTAPLGQLPISDIPRKLLDEHLGSPAPSRRQRNQPEPLLEIFANEDQLGFGNSVPTPEPFASTLVDLETVREHEALEEAHSVIGKAARIDQVVEALQRAMPGLTNLVIYKSGSKFVLHSVRGKEPPVPAYLAGDGFKRLLSLAASVFAMKNGSVLLEEPETYQHPRYMQELVRLLYIAARAGTQIILSTHSMELIDMLLHAPDAEGQAYPVVHRMSLYDGTLHVTTIEREVAVRVRGDLLQDLRA
jgi:energy-coupling factor transporter ATP-binding protein EcfA2